MEAIGRCRRTVTPYFIHLPGGVPRVDGYGEKEWTEPRALRDA